MFLQVSYKGLSCSTFVDEASWERVRDLVRKPRVRCQESSMGRLDSDESLLSLSLFTISELGDAAYLMSRHSWNVAGTDLMSVV